MAWTEFLLKKLGILTTNVVISKTLPKVELIDANGKSATIEKIAADDELKITNEAEKAGAVGKAIHFDQTTNGYVNCGNDASLQVAETSSIAFWMKIDSTLVANGFICHKNTAVLSSLIDPAGNLSWFTNHTTGSNTASTAGTDYRDDAWHFVVLTLNTSTETKKITIDNVEKYTNTDPKFADLLSSASLDFYIGKRDPGSELPLLGDLDEFAIIKRDIQASGEAATWFALGINGILTPDADFVLLLHMDDEANPTDDASTSGNDGTLGAGATFSTGYLLVPGTDVVRNMISSEKGVGAGEAYIVHVGDKTNADGTIKLQGGKIVLPADGRKLFFGAGEDASFNYDGSDFDMDVSEVAPSDLKLTCGANKTIELQNVVYNDLYLPIISARQPAANFPTWSNFDTNLKAYTFALNDYVDLTTAEVLHDYKEGTNLTVHVHIVTDGANDGTERKVKYIAYYSWGDLNEVMPAEANVSAEQTIIASEADKTHHVLTLGTITGTGYKIGSIIKMRIKRIAGTGVEPANDPFVEMVGVHYQINTIGSRQELIK